jgi:hypothetical protein
MGLAPVYLCVQQHSSTGWWERAHSLLHCPGSSLLHRLVTVLDAGDRLGCLSQPPSQGPGKVPITFVECVFTASVLLHVLVNVAATTTTQ